MEISGKSILIIVITVIAAFLVVYGSVILLSPAYRDKLKKRPMTHSKNKRRVLDKIGSFDLEPGKGISYELSGQKWSPDAPGLNPNLTGHYDKDIKETPDPKGEKDFFNMFME